MTEPPPAAHVSDSERAPAPPTARDLLRSALVDEEDPRFPWWLPVPGLLLALLWAAYQAVSAGASQALDATPPLEVLLETLLWPGLAIFALGTAVTFFGWQLEID